VLLPTARDRKKAETFERSCTCSSALRYGSSRSSSTKLVPGTRVRFSCSVFLAVHRSDGAEIRGNALKSPITNTIAQLYRRDGDPVTAMRAAPTFARVHQKFMLDIGVILRFFSFIESREREREREREIFKYLPTPRYPRKMFEERSLHARHRACH